MSLLTELENFFLSIAINIPRRWRFQMPIPQIPRSQQSSGFLILLDFVDASSEELICRAFRAPSLIFQTVHKIWQDQQALKHNYRQKIMAEFRYGSIVITISDSVPSSFDISQTNIKRRAIVAETEIARER